MTKGKMQIKSILLVGILFFSLFNVSHAQKIIINNVVTNRPLTWEDYTGAEDRNSAYHALTGYEVATKSDQITIVGDSVHIGIFEVTVSFLPEKSWVRAGQATKELLVHEQGHFNLGILCMREIYLRYQHLSLHRNTYKEVLSHLISSTIGKYHDLGVQYDKETNHSMDKAEQHRWNEEIAAQLANIKQ